MKRKKGSDEDTINLHEDWINGVIEVIQNELEIESLGLEEKNTLERIVVLSVGLYMAEMRESFNRTSRLSQ